MTNQVPKIVLIGAGNIGKRTLQSLVALDRPASIIVVDPSTDALEAARVAAGEFESEETHAISYETELPVITDALDLAIIATSSGPRFEIMKDLLERVSVRNLILEKFLFQRHSDYAAAAALLERIALPCWVSCPRPVWPGYLDLADRIAGRSGTVMVVSGSAWNMASNAIHLLDCFSRISKERIVQIDGTALDPDPFDNKRAGYREVSGQLTARGERGGVVALICDRTGSTPLRVHVYSGDERFFISESGQTMLVQTGGDESTEAFPILMASQLTSVYSDILRTGTCGLSRYEALAPLHQDLMFVLNRIFFQSDDRDQPCPVT